MLAISNSKDVRTVVYNALAQYDWLYLEKGARHAQIWSKRAKDYVPVPFTPSDGLAPHNLKAQLRRLAIFNQGVISSRNKKH